MLPLHAIFEEDESVREYLLSRQILDQYKKARSMLIGGHAQKYDFKLRKPKSE